MEARKHRATAFTKKHRPFQKGQTAGATSRRRHVSTSNISLLSFFNARFTTTITEIILFFRLFNATITTTIAPTLLLFPFVECRMDCAFYMYMNLKHYSNDGTAATLEPEQVPELRKKILYQLISQHRGNTKLSLIKCTTG